MPAVYVLQSKEWQLAADGGTVAEICGSTKSRSALKVRNSIAARCYALARPMPSCDVRLSRL